MSVFFRPYCFFLLCFLCICGKSFGDGFNQSSFFGFRYGPNLSWSIFGNTPFVWGQWLPQLEGVLNYTWLEPIGSLNYGNKLENGPTYLKMNALLELSPFYGGYRAGLGIRPFKTNPQVEINFVYESFLYFRSNMEMVRSDEDGKGRIAETWNADYVVDNIWTDEAANFDYAQLFDMSANVEYFFKKGSLLGASFHYILSDVGTDFEDKSYDYNRNIPVFSRDFLIEIASYGCIPFNKNWSIIYETTYYRTGNLRSGNTIQKESLSYGEIMLGPHFTWKEGLQNITLEVGMWNRTKKRFYEGSFAQKFLIQFEYHGYFSFPFHGNF